MNLRDVHPVGLPVKTTADLSVRCSTRYAHPAAGHARFRSSPVTIVRCIAATVFQNKGNNKYFKNAPFGAHFYLNGIL